MPRPFRASITPAAGPQSRSSDIWSRLGYSSRDSQKRIIWSHVPPLPRDVLPWARTRPSTTEATNLERHFLLHPNRRAALCPLQSWRAQQPTAPREQWLPGFVMRAPVALAALGTDPVLNWPSVHAAYTGPTAYLHLTNDYHCFPQLCRSHASRLFWMRAHGYWDTRLDSLSLTPHGAPFRVAPQTDPTRVLTLTSTARGSLARLARDLRTSIRLPWGDRGRPYDGPPPTGLQKALARYRFRTLLHNLVTVAALVGRTPVIPTVPCEFLFAVQRTASQVGDATDDATSASSNFRLNRMDFDVMTDASQQPVCRPAPGHADGTCTARHAMSDFDFADFSRQLNATSADGFRTATVDVPSGQPDTALLRDADSRRTGVEVDLPAASATPLWRLLAICRRASRLAELPVLQLDLDLLDEVTRLRSSNWRGCHVMPCVCCVQLHAAHNANPSPLVVGQLLDVPLSPEAFSKAANAPLATAGPAPIWEGNATLLAELRQACPGGLRRRRAAQYHCGGYLLNY